MIEVIAHWLTAARSGSQEPIVRQVIEASLPGAVERVVPRIDTMRLSEARGYVRARAVDIVRRHTRMALAVHPTASADVEAGIVRTATERLVPLVLRETGVGVPAAAKLAAAA